MNKNNRNNNKRYRRQLGTRIVEMGLYKVNTSAKLLPIKPRYDWKQRAMDKMMTDVKRSMLGIIVMLFFYSVTALGAVGCVSALIGCVSAPVGCVSAPVGCASAPVGCASAPVGCVSAPVGCASARVGVSMCKSNFALKNNRLAFYSKIINRVYCLVNDHVSQRLRLPLPQV